MPISRIHQKGKQNKTGPTGGSSSYQRKARRTKKHEWSDFYRFAFWPPFFFFSLPSFCVFFLAHSDQQVTKEIDLSMKESHDIDITLSLLSFALPLLHQHSSKNFIFFSFSPLQTGSVLSAIWVLFLFLSLLLSWLLETGECARCYPALTVAEYSCSVAALSSDTGMNFNKDY